MVKLLLAAGRGQHRELAGDEEVTTVTALDPNQIAHVTEMVHVLSEDDFHGHDLLLSIHARRVRCKQ